jgi:glycosyltransferase involved in cell wall biosynthesis
MLLGKIDQNINKNNMLEVSIVICTYNRNHLLKKCLQSLLLLDADKQIYEVIVVDNNCTDDTVSICTDFIVQHSDIKLRIVAESNQGLGYARNKGIKESCGEYISFIDDDAEVTPNFINAIIVTFRQHIKSVALGGKILPVFEDGKEPAWLSKYLSGALSKVDYGETAKPFPKKYPFGCNMVFRRFVFEKYGYFNGKLNRSDDKDMFMRLKTHKVKIWYEPTIIVYHNILNERITFSAITKIASSGGKFEAMRLKEESVYTKIVKGLELLLKLFASLIIGSVFCVRGQISKARYLIAYMYNLYIGYVKHILKQ